MPAATTHAEQQMLNAMATMTDEMRELKERIHTMEVKVCETKEIVEAWGAVKTAGKFIKWMGVLIGSLTAIAVGVKLGISHLMGK